MVFRVLFFLAETSYRTSKNFCSLQMYANILIYTRNKIIIFKKNDVQFIPSLKGMGFLGRFS